MDETWFPGILIAVLLLFMIISFQAEASPWKKDKEAVEKERAKYHAEWLKAHKCKFPSHDKAVRKSKKTPKLWECWECHETWKYLHHAQTWLQVEKELG